MLAVLRSFQILANGRLTSSLAVCAVIDFCSPSGCYAIRDAPCRGSGQNGYVSVGASTKLRLGAWSKIAILEHARWPTTCFRWDVVLLPSPISPHYYSGVFPFAKLVTRICRLRVTNIIVVRVVDFDRLGQALSIACDVGNHSTTVVIVVMKARGYITRDYLICEHC